MLWKMAMLSALAAPVPLLAQATGNPAPAVAALSGADSPAERDRTYAMHAREGDLYEVASSRLALKRSRDRRIRSFAQMMISHHSRSSNELARLDPARSRVSERDLWEPKAQMLDKLRSSTAADFDSNYVRGQIAAHEEALGLHRAYAAGGANAALRAFAGGAVALVEGHLARARALPTASR